MTDPQLRVLIDRQVRASLETAIARRTDQLTDKMVNEMFADAASRKQFHLMVRAAFDRALAAMTRNGRRSPPHGRRRR